MPNEIAKPLSAEYIRNVAQFVRKILGVDDEKPVDVLKSLDRLTFEFTKYDFNYMILPDDNDLFNPFEEAKTDIVNGTIYIKESVYSEAAHRKYCRAHFTIAHELGHFVLHRVLNLMNFARSSTCVNHRIYESPEWQADTFAMELLMPLEQCLNLSPKEIRKKYRVTLSAAKVRYEKINKNK